MNLSKIDKAHIIAVLGIIGTGVAAIVPSESGNIQAVVVALGGGVSALYPIVKAIEKLADSNVSATDVKVGAIDAARTELSRVDFNGLVSDAVNAKGVGDVEGLVRGEVARVLGQMFQQPAVTSAPLPPSSPPPPPA